jgi:hypothetical protein
MAAYAEFLLGKNFGGDGGDLVVARLPQRRLGLRVATSFTIWIAATASQPAIRIVAPRRSGSTHTVGAMWPRLSMLAIEAANERQWAADGAGACGTMTILRSSIPILGSPSGDAATSAFGHDATAADFGGATGDMTRFPTGMSDLPFHIRHYADGHCIPNGRLAVA